jgi:hypothetical protein
MEQYYTKKNILQEIVDWIRDLKLIDSEWNVIDFSCGFNFFAPALSPHYKSFDLDPPNDANEINKIIKSDWLQVSQEEIPSPCVIGLNPPFGYQGKLLRDFVCKAISFNPKFIAILHPNLDLSFSYEEKYYKEIPFDSFYTVDEKGISKPFSIYTRVSLLFPKENTKEEISETIASNSNLLHVYQCGPVKPQTRMLVRRTGNSSGQQIYCITGDNVSYIFRGKVELNKHWKDNDHTVENVECIAEKKKSCNRATKKDHGNKYRGTSWLKVNSFIDRTHSTWMRFALYVQKQWNPSDIKKKQPVLSKKKFLQLFCDWLIIDNK